MPAARCSVIILAAGLLAADEALPAASSIRVGAGASAVSTYPGSDTVRIVPTALITARRGCWLLDTTIFRGPLLGATIGDGELVAAGGALLRFGRAADADPHLDGQREIAPAVTAAGSLAWAPGQSLVQLRVQAVQDMGAAGEGLSLRGDLILRAPPQPHLLIQAAYGVTWADSTHMQAYFGSRGGTVANAGPATTADAGRRDSHVVVEGLVPLAGSWSGVFQVEVARLHGDAAASPLTRRRDQLAATIGLTYDF